MTADERAGGESMTTIEWRERHNTEETVVVVGEREKRKLRTGGEKM